MNHPNNVYPCPVCGDDCEISVYVYETVCAKCGTALELDPDADCAGDPPAYFDCSKLVVKQDDHDRDCDCEGCVARRLDDEMVRGDMIYEQERDRRMEEKK